VILRTDRDHRLRDNIGYGLCHECGGFAPEMADLSAYYRALDLEPGASIDQVKIAWRDLAQVWHPDRFPNNERLKAKAEEQLKQINEGYHGIAPVGAADSPSRPASRYQPETHSSGSTEVSHVDILAEGVLTWNLWRKKYMDVVPQLVGVRLARRPLEGVDLREAHVDRANLEGADLYKANGSHASFRDARLNGVVLHRTIALEADFSGADFTAADLTAADMRGCLFGRTRFDGADLLGTRLEGADLSQAIGLTDVQRLSTLLDSTTKWPR
jgi:hypothetical protein